MQVRQSGQLLQSWVLDLSTWTSVERKMQTVTSQNHVAYIWRVPCNTLNIYIYIKKGFKDSKTLFLTLLDADEETNEQPDFTEMQNKWEKPWM